MTADPKLQAWFTFLQAHDAATESLDAELFDRTGLTFSDYEVLLFLSRATGGGHRVAELAHSLLLTASGTTRASTGSSATGWSGERLIPTMAARSWSRSPPQDEGGSAPRLPCTWRA